MGGFFGVVSKTDCVCDLYYGTDYHSHLGTKRGGLAIQDKEGNFTRKIHDISNAQFRSKFDNDIPKFAGVAGIGSISDGEAQPLIISSKFGCFAIVTVGRINNIDKIVSKAFELGHSHLSENGDGELNPTEIVAMLVCTKKSIPEGIEYAQKVIDGSCSLLILSGKKIYAARDRYGRTPVILGKKADNMAVTMETTAFPNLDYSIDRELGPGEVVEITCDGAETLVAPGKTMKLCSFFWVYYGYPSSIYEGVTTEVARYRNGILLAEDDREMLNSIDSICGIPDSGIPHAIGYSIAAGKPYQRAFVKYTPTWPRSFMPQNQKLRDLVARMKLIPICDLIRGKRLLFCDDSIVRGTQLKDTVKRLYEDGVKEVHMRSACPPLVFGCPFINFSRSRSELDLATRRAIVKLEGTEDLSDEVIREYLVYNSPKYLAMVDEIRKSLNLTTLKFQSLEKLIAAIGLPAEKVCTYCWNGCDVKDEEPQIF
ncbi:MAG: amidophosphoribosyltransferase [Lentisphaeria bacterium]|nr:amidophosphoribosyltransferase [Lentisphaeria bacterium]MBR7119747.1 amidophosphoribosyltransferase [Lentisphaeria bacterium]